MGLAKPWVPAAPPRYCPPAAAESASSPSSNPDPNQPRYEPSTGRVELNGSGVRTLASEELRRTVAYVPQDAGLVRGTVLHNIRYGAVPTPVELLTDGERAEHG